ncbi:MULTISPECIES: PH domain-containing protein [unclassified Brevibacterium]|uniref:PH domain-containing protein n=1 Tax=unclassified Brevibacterium TaxID=2614124 RepID=UPI0010F50B4D|nr:MULTISPECIES: PH domain-containing protein [unclassified Brevibacterium]MCM1013614.1 PH domain-containing protein [Brevibacterium sp. XM4083]
MSSDHGITEETGQSQPGSSPPAGPSQPGSQPALAEAAAPEVWHRVHPLTPVLESLGVIVVLFVVAGYVGQNFIQQALSDLAAGDGVDLSLAGWLGAHPLVILAGLGGVLLVLAVAGVYSWLAWRVMGYRVDAEAIYARSGLLAKKLRKARLDRVQSIDLQQKLVPRLLGLAELVFDVAGGKGANVSLKYLSRKKADALRDELLAAVREVKQGGRTAGAAGGAAAGAAGGAEALDGPAAWTGEDGTVDSLGAGQGPGEPTVDLSAPERAGDSIGVRLSKRLSRYAGEALEEAEDSLNDMLAPYGVSPRLSEEGEIIRVPVHRVILSSLLKTDFLIGVLVVVAVVIATIVLFALGFREAAVPMIFGVLPAGIAAFASVKKDLDNANFVVRLTDSGLAVSHGLVSTSRKVIPLDRVQAVCLHQPLLWRIGGWWKAEYNIASAGDKGESNLLLPVGDIDQALTMIGLALPAPQVDDGVSARSLTLSAMYDTDSPDPQAARAEEAFRPQPRSSRFIDPLVWKRRAYALTEALLIIRLGRLERRVDFVPHERVQSMEYRQGPLLRALGLASVAVHSTAGPITPQVAHQDAEAARRFFDEHAERTRLARERFDEQRRTGQGIDA